MEMVWDWKSITSLLATIVFIRAAARDFLPPELRHFLRTLFGRIHSSFRPTNTFYIEELDTSGNSNELFEAAQSYLSSRCLAEAPVLRLCKSKNSKTLTSSLPSSHSTVDVFQGVPMKWSYHTVDRSSSGSSAFSGSSRSDPDKYYDLSFHCKHRGLLYSRYLQHVLDEAARLKLKSRDRKLYTNRPFGSYRGELWSSIPFHHPSTFDTLAVDPALRDSIRNDLLRFSARRDYYARVGRAWKRGYLLHGPPGTGKTSLIAAIANFLEFDIYDIELTAVHSNTDLRKLLVSTSTKSVIVIEDIDCSLDLSDRAEKRIMKPNRGPKPDHIQSHEYEHKDGGGTSAGGDRPVFPTVSLSGVLNFVDGLWSSCVGERLIIFTTNHPERLDKALLRPGRMDRKIHLSHCEPAAFRVLAKNYLEVAEGLHHELMEAAEVLLGEVKVTPADVAEVFMGCDGLGADFALGKLVEELRNRKKKVPAAQADINGGSEKEEEEDAEAGVEESEALSQVVDRFLEEMKNV